MTRANPSTVKNNPCRLFYFSQDGYGSNLIISGKMILFGDNSFETSRYEGGNVDEDARERKTAPRGQVFRLPLGIELLLIFTQPLKVVEVFAMTENKCTETVPDRGENIVLKSG